MADGCIVHTNRVRHLKTMDSIQERYYTQLKLASADMRHIEKFCQCISSTHPIRTYAYDNYDGRYSRVIIEDQHMFDALMHIGMLPNKSLIVKYPLIPDGLDAPFIRGYFDGNGSITLDRSNECSITSTYEMLQKIFEKCPFNESKVFHPKQRYPERQVNSWSLKFAGTQQCLNVLEWMYAGSNELTRLDRKYDKYIELAKANGRLPQ